MARRGKSSAAEDLMDLVARLPWWAGIALAFASYWALRAMATRPLSEAEAAHPGSLIATAIWQGLATAGQYVLPLICLVGAAVSAARRRKRQTLFENASTSKSVEALQDMTWQQFELLVGEGFRRRGYAVKELGGGGADGGVDLVLTKAGEKSFVQCKQWKAFRVGVSTVRELYGVMAAHGASSGFVVTSGRFTQEATAFAEGRNIHLIDGAALMQLLREARESGMQGKKLRSSAASSREATPPNTAMHQLPRADIARTDQKIEPPAPADPACPKCGQPMVLRIAKRGTSAGQAFWGCSNYSNGCRGTREISSI